MITLSSHNNVSGDHNVQILLAVSNILGDMEPWELGKKCNGNFILTFDITKVRYDGLYNLFVWTFFDMDNKVSRGVLLVSQDEKIGYHRVSFEQVS